MLTIGNYVFLGFLAIVLIAISISIGVCTDSIALALAQVSLVLLSLLLLFAVSAGIIPLLRLASAPIKIINLI